MATSRQPNRHVAGNLRRVATIARPRHIGAALLLLVAAAVTGFAQQGPPAPTPPARANWELSDKFSAEALLIMQVAWSVTDTWKVVVTFVVAPADCRRQAAARNPISTESDDKMMGNRRSATDSGVRSSKCTMPVR